MATPFSDTLFFQYDFSGLLFLTLSHRYPQMVRTSDKRVKSSAKYQHQACILEQLVSLATLVKMTCTTTAELDLGLFNQLWLLF